MAELRIDRFSSGKTDHYINGKPTASKELDNFVINRNEKPEQRIGFLIHDENNYRIPAGNQRLGALKWFGGDLFQFSGRYGYFIDITGWNTLEGPVDSNDFFGAGDEDSMQTVVEWNNHLYATTDEWSRPRKVFKNEYQRWQVRNVGLPALANAPTVTPDVDDSKSYVYYLHYQYDYSLETDQEFIDYGAVTQVLVENAADMSGTGHYNQLSGIPVISNSTTECWDTGEIKVKIYRSTDAGSLGRYCGEVTNGTTTFEDTVIDADLGTETVYITGGVVDYDVPPDSKYCVVCNDMVWYAHTRDSAGREFRNRVYQSLQGNPDAVPATFYTDMDFDITGIGSIGIYPIVFSNNQCWRLEGYVDSLGRGFVKKNVISDTVGCVNHHSIVSTETGVYFSARDGFYFTNGGGVQKLSTHLNESYDSLTDTEEKRKRIYGVLDNSTRRVIWATYKDDGSTDNNMMWILDPFFGLSEESTFTTFSSGDDLNPSCMVFDNSILYFGDINGYVHRFTKRHYTDPVIDTSTAPSNWLTKGIPYDLQSCSWSLGTEVQNKWTTHFYMVCRNLSNLSILPQTQEENIALWTSMNEKRFRSNLLWGDTDVVWGDEDVYWNYQDEIKIKRRFPAGHLRCVYKQIRLVPSYTIISNSDSYETATVDATAKTLTLAIKTWPENCEGYYIHVEDDSYADDLLITARTDTVLTVVDDNGTLVDGLKAWLVKGYRKGERFNPLAYTIKYQPFGTSYTGYAESEDGANA